MNTAIAFWQVLVVIGAVLTATTAWGWFHGQYEVTWPGRYPYFTRRWYGNGARVVFHADADLKDPAWFQVLDWADESTDVPWVLIGAPDDEEFPACWCPVTDLAPYAVRRLRPRIFRYGWLRVPVPFAYVPLLPARRGEVP